MYCFCFVLFFVFLFFCFLFFLLQAWVNPLCSSPPLAIFAKISSPFFQHAMCSSIKSLEESKGQEDEPPMMVEAVTHIQEEVSPRETGTCTLPFPFFFSLCLFLLHDLINFIDVDMGTKESKLVTTEEAKGPLPAVQTFEA